MIAQEEARIEYKWYLNESEGNDYVSNRVRYCRQWVES